MAGGVRVERWRYQRLTACAFAVLFLFATSAPAACPGSPKVIAAQQKDPALGSRLLRACLDDGAKMHNICDNVSTCTTADTKAILQQKITKAQQCINARRQITSNWYAGNADAGHDQAVENKVNQANNCIVKFHYK